MATYLWSSLSNGDIIDFDPSTDVLHFDDPGIPAAQITGFFYFDPFFLISGFVVTDWYQGVLLLFLEDQRAFTQTNFTFADGSVLLNGDNAVGTVYDEGPNTLVGGAGHDQLAGYGGNDSLVGGAGNDLLNGGAGNDTLIGGTGNDQLFDDAGRNRLEGGDGADFFFVVDLAFVGSSTIAGGAGRDEYLPIFAFDDFYYVAPDPPIVTDFQAGPGGDLLNFGALLAQIVYSGYYFFQDLFDPYVGFLWFYQYGADTVLLYDPDTAYYAGYGYVPVITLNNVSLSSVTVDNISQFAPGSDNADNLVGTDSRDFLYGAGGSDTLNGGPGADTMQGGDGPDVYYVENPKDAIAENTARIVSTAFTFAGPDGPIPFGPPLESALDDLIDTVRAAVSYSLESVAGVENITLTGAAEVGAGVFAKGNSLANVVTGNELGNELDGLEGDDTLVGAGGADTLRGGTGNDSMAGGIGDDTYLMDAAGDVVTELPGEGTDRVEANVSYTITANVENLALVGNGTINGTGNDFANTMTGNGAANVLRGAAGNDTLNGGGGNDTLDGGAGIDTAIYSGNLSAFTIGAAGVAVSGPAGSDTLSNIERLQFSDASLAFDLDRGEAAGNTVRLIGAAFGKQYLTPEIIGIVVDVFDAGYSLPLVSAAALTVLGSPGNAEFVGMIFRNVVEIDPPADAQAALVGLLDSGAMTQAQMLEIVANLELNETHIGLVGMQQNGVEFI